MSWSRDEKGVINFEIGDSIALRIYPDNSPRNLETSPLYKGVVIVFEGVELVGEGMGFGVPLVKYKDKTYFPGSGNLIYAPNIVTKTFILNTVSRKYYQNRQILDSIYRPIHGLFSFFYLRIKRLRGLFDGVMNLRERCGIQTRFEKVEPRGTVTVNYKIESSMLVVDVYFDVKIDDVEEFVILNEQGSEFTQYNDSDGNGLKRKEIGAWDRVIADSAWLVNNSGVSYQIWNKDGLTLNRGWEDVPGRLSWSGLNYTFSPERKQVVFRVGVHRGSVRCS